MTAEELARFIDQNVIGRKAYRNRQILKLHFIDGYTYEQVAEAVEMSPVQVGRIVRREGDKILLKIKK